MINHQKSICLIFYIFSVFSSSRMNGQDDAVLLDELLRGDSMDVNTLAAYPETSRNAAFELASRPEAITRLHDLRKKSNDDFKNAVSGLSQDDQQRIYNLARYEGLMGELSAGGKKTGDQVKTILNPYPAEIHQDARYCNEQYNSLLAVLQKQHDDFNQSYQQLVNDFPQETRSAFKELLNLPEVITLLADNMKMTVRLGDLYKHNPGLVRQKFADLNLELARQKAKDAEEWKALMEKNPEAAGELSTAAKEYAREEGYSGTDYQETDPVVIEHYHYVPYPYWCGYPWWYTDPYWYPRPYWYHWGFYYWQGNIVWIGYPSWYFMHWHFNHPHHFYHYPHLSDAYVSHYYGPRRAAVSNTRIVQKWASENRQHFTSGFLNNDAKRVDRIREYGKVEMDLEKYKKENPGKAVDKNTYIKQKKAEFPALQPVVRTPKSGTVIKQPTSPGRNEKDPAKQNIQPPVKKDGDPKKTAPRNNPPVKKQEPAPPPKKSTGTSDPGRKK